MLRTISNIIILISIIGFLSLNFIDISQIKTNEKIISNILYNNTSNHYYVGYIEIKNLNIKVPLVYGTSAKELNQNVVGINNHSTDNHLILSGHAINSVFLSLYNIKLETAIVIMQNNNEYHYIVDNIKIVKKEETNVYNNTGLTLITCVNKEKRLIVHAKTA